MGYNPLNFGSPQNNDGERLKTAFTKVDEMLAEIFTLLPGKQPANSFLSSLSALNGTGIVTRTGSGDAALQTLGAVGPAILAAGDAAAARAILGLGVAATLSVEGPGGAVVRGTDAKIPFDDLPPIAFDNLINRPSNFPPAPHTHAYPEISGVPGPLTQLAGLVGEGLLARGPSGVMLRTATNFGLGLVAAADSAAGRGLLGLGPVATGGWDIEGGAARIVGGKISASLIPAINYDLDPQFPATEAARLALPNDIPAGTLVFQETPPGIFVVTVDPVNRFYNFTPPGSPVLSVFGLTGNVALANLPALVGAVEDGDSLPILDGSAATHAKITRAALLSMATAPDGKAGLTDGTASLMVANSAGTLARVALADWLWAHPVSTAPSETDVVLTGAVGAPPRRTAIGDLFTGRVLRNVRLQGVTETKSARQDVSGAVTLAPLDAGNVRHVRLIGNTVLTLPARPTVANGTVGLTLIVEQDGTGGRSLTVQGAGGDVLAWSGGTAVPAAAAANSITVYSLMGWAETPVWLAGKWF